MPARPQRERRGEEDRDGETVRGVLPGEGETDVEDGAAEDLGENEPCNPQHQHGREVAAGARQRIYSCENPRKSGQGAGLP